MPDTAGLLHRLHERLGSSAVLTGDGLQAYEVDWRGRWAGRALAVVQPRSTAEVADVVRLCAQAGVCIVPQGGNTSTVGGSVPDASGAQVVLSLRAMNRIRAIAPANLTLTAEAGCLLAQVQQAAADHDLLYPLRLASEGQCTIGGNLATNAGGTQVLRYGNTRELCLGLEVVTPAGEIWSGLSSLRKDNTGYDLRDLFIGSEGTLGIITAATLRLFPRPSVTATAWVACDGLAQAVALLHRLRCRFDAALTAFELINATALDIVARHEPACAAPLTHVTPWAVLLELGSSDAQIPLQQALADELHVAVRDSVISDAALAQHTGHAAAFWRTREAIPTAQARDGLNVKHDIAVPTHEIPRLVDRVTAALHERWPGARLVLFGHLGDGNLHFNVAAPADMPARDFLAAHEGAINAVVFDEVARHGGSIAAEHGIGRLRRETLARYKDATALALMRSLKRALDPQGLMNPGCLLPQ
ncbi:MAG: FAD-binding oxidoreductase [Pseudomonadota bacterium]